jgi:hypothetical protein
MRKSRRTIGQSGQALAEYHILYPAGILLAIAVVVLVGGAARDLMDHGIEGLMYSLLGGSAPPGSYFHPGMVCVEYEQIANQELGGSFCEQHENCYHYDRPVNQGIFSIAGHDINMLVIKAGREYHLYESGTTEDGCYNVTITGETVSWERVGSGPDCKDISHLQMWYDTFVTHDAEVCTKWEAEPPPY